MCGICGIFRPEGVTPRDLRVVSAMVADLRHRGPNKQQTLQDGRVVLGHDRLSILDLSPAAGQPMHSADGRFLLVCNGEIYNYVSLREQLERQGHIFRTTSDTEVLLELFATLGAACLPLLNGMFAFAVWDRREQRLTLARDRFGQKPLFYARQADAWIFASEVMALFRQPGLERRADPNALFHYLTVQSVPAPWSAFQGVRKLPPAHCLSIGPDNRARLWRYWTPETARAFAGSDEEAEEILDALLQKAVARHRLSDVPVGLFLSGGVDSSLVAALACRQEAEMRSFCMGFAESSHDERAFAAEAARLCGTRHSDACAEPDVAALLPDMARHYGEPFADSSALPTWLLCRMTGKHVSVALSGDGGDDLFGGYERYLDPFLYEGDVPAAISRQHAELLDELAPAGRPRDALALTPAMSKYYFHWARFCGAHKRRLCAPELRAAAQPALSLQLMLEHFQRHARMPLLARMQLFELEYYLASTLMPKVDIAAMASSLEVRAPLLDAEVADFALALPVEMRVRRVPGGKGGSFGKGWEAKWLLKKVAARYLPPEFIYRRKMGFGVPLAQWLRGSLRELVCDTLLSSACAQRGWLEPAAVRALVTEHMTGAVNHEYRLWAVLMLELWAQYCLTSE
ncbi:asparagine synthase (glutamine-hydrolyzing) [Desulfovibrio sp. ZJ200]|uniref:asparagine synthase (glutamine-hydrolyzing) n=1 Tax=Desulfovibrio sp. ZJ200 TaxID=2709792 RepID=UPI0013EAD714|nr:asparagine synthase (glutamine-hydrolyzing) [Desulfovibrio sp. ZJ200]